MEKHQRDVNLLTGKCSCQDERLACRHLIAAYRSASTSLPSNEASLILAQTPADRLALMYDPQCFVTAYQTAYSGQLLELPGLRQLKSDGLTLQPTKTEKKAKGGSVRKTRFPSTGEISSKKRKSKTSGGYKRKHRRRSNAPSKGSDDVSWLGPSAPSACNHILAQIDALGSSVADAEATIGGAQIQLNLIVQAWNALHQQFPWTEEGGQEVAIVGELLESTTTAVATNVTSLDTLSSSVEHAMTQLKTLVHAMVSSLTAAAAEAEAVATANTSSGGGGGSSSACASAGTPFHRLA